MNAYDHFFLHSATIFKQMVLANFFFWLVYNHYPIRVHLIERILPQLHPGRGFCSQFSRFCLQGRKRKQVKCEIKELGFQLVLDRRTDEQTDGRAEG